MTQPLESKDFMDVIHARKYTPPTFVHLVANLMAKMREQSMVPLEKNHINIGPMGLHIT